MSKLGILRLSYESLAGLLGLPSGHIVTAIAPQDAHDVGNQAISIIVSGPQLPEHLEGASLQIVSLTRNHRGKSEFC